MPIEQIRHDLFEYIEDNFVALLANYEDFILYDSESEKEQNFREFLNPHKENFAFAEHVIMNITLDFLNSKLNSSHYNIVVLEYDISESNIRETPLGIQYCKDTNKEAFYKKPVYLLRFRFKDGKGDHVDGTSPVEGRLEI